MNLQEALVKYGDSKVRFTGYYKYSFTFKGTTPNGHNIEVWAGGNPDDIYRFDVGLGEEILKSLDCTPHYIKVTDGDIVLVDIYEY